MYNFCASYKDQDRGYDASGVRSLPLHEQTSEANSRMMCVTQIMAMPGTRTIVAGLFVHVWVGCVR